ncbi:PREDICTED: uncharacterized protein LOC106750717 [Dinoponera quadriceps]|uniref:Uncharacterized protein LOC106750717 n=1 Tax=Dinoponera quadriceps TaxID=609295 RepID=A0A6P3Y759_DINQU|nr:PREDICTED: uncharacterized protein LOC106750717 [Dinoponera quadriceps]
MSLCPSSSHQLVAAAIAFRRARRKFPKDFGLESAVECASGCAKAETATSREGPINQARSSSSLLVKRACGSRSDHVCPTSARGHDYDNPYAGGNSISCSCCRNGRNGEEVSALRDECSGGDAIDTVPCREREEVPATSGADKNEFAKPAERDRCETHGRICDGRTRHKSWRDSMRGESSRLYERHCHSKNSDIISAAREDEERENEGEDDDEDDDDVAVINHKDSMCILAEKYKAGRRCGDGRCEDQAAGSAGRTGKDECNKSLTSEIIDQPALPESADSHEESSVKHVCRAHCESCGTAIADTCNRARRHVPSEIEYELLKSPLSDLAAARCCSTRVPCRSTF